MLEEDDDSGCTGVDDSGSVGESEERDSRGKGEGASESEPLGSGLVVGDFEPVSVQEKISHKSRPRAIHFRILHFQDEHW